MYDIGNDVLVSKLLDPSDEYAKFLDESGKVDGRWSSLGRTVYVVKFPNGEKGEFYHQELRLIK